MHPVRQTSLSILDHFIDIGALNSWKRLIYSRYLGRTFAVNDIDRKCMKYLNYTCGTFVELGAYDGLHQSNTLLFEKELGWRGLLIEAIPCYANRCRRHRPGNLVVNALVCSPENAGKMLEVVEAGLFSTVIDPQTSNTLTDISIHVDRGRSHRAANRRRVHRLIAKPLSAILAEHHIRAVDLLSIDVEGNELDVIAGLDFDECAIKSIVVETRREDSVSRLLPSHFALREQLAQFDYLYLNTAAFSG